MSIVGKVMDFLHIGRKSDAAKAWEAARGVASEVGHVWVKLNPNEPHVGISHVSGDAESPWKDSVKVTGVTPEFAKQNFVGKVVELTEDAAQLIKLGKFIIDHRDFVKLFR